MFGGAVGGSRDRRSCLAAETGTAKVRISFGSTAAVVVLAFLFYPMTLAPLGNDTNGGTLGLGSLVVASALAWRAFLFNTINPWLRRLVQIPLTAIVTYMVIAEVVVQYRHWLMKLLMPH